uniref:Uncharacterized protein n=1 Tax=Schizaphis graminum TaxID=13262 RepID=A0A2S2PCV8_SCHGA
MSASSRDRMKLCAVKSSLPKPVEANNQRVLCARVYSLMWLTKYLFQPPDKEDIVLLRPCLKQATVNGYPANTPVAISQACASYTSQCLSTVPTKTCHKESYGSLNMV